MQFVNTSWCLLNTDATACYVNACINAALWCRLSNTALTDTTWGPHMDEFLSSTDERTGEYHAFAH